MKLKISHSCRENVWLGLPSTTISVNTLQIPFVTTLVIKLSLLVGNKWNYGKESQVQNIPSCHKSIANAKLSNHKKIAIADLKIKIY